MSLALYVLVNILVLVLFFKYQRRRIHVLEIFFYWAVSTILIQNQSAILSMNLKWVIIPDVLSLELAHLLNRTVLYPVLTVMFLNQYINFNRAGKKLPVLLSYVVLLTGLERLADWLGVLNHVHWHFWWSVLFWLVYLFLMLGIMKAFRNKLYKEVLKA